MVSWEQNDYMRIHVSEERFSLDNRLDSHGHKIMPLNVS